MRRKQIILLVLALFMAMTTCLYCATLADFSLEVKIGFGMAVAILYIVLNLIPFFLRRRKDAELSLPTYLKTYLNEIITKD